MRNILVALLLFTTAGSYAQKKDKNPALKFGNIQPADFDPAIHSFDTTADAVILSEVGKSYFRENSDNGFSVVFEKHQRIKIITKNGLDAANFIIQQYKSGSKEEKVDKLKASTFNLVNGKVEESKLLDKDIFKDKIDKNYSFYKFGLPNVKEGSIIEITYTINSDFIFNLRGWAFQGKYPKVHTAYNVQIPNIFRYIVLSRGYLTYSENTTDAYPHTFNIMYSATGTGASQHITMPTVINETHWAIDKVPALKREPFVTALDNHIAQVNFQLAEIKYPEQEAVQVMSSWPKVGEELMKDEEFGAHLAKNNNWLNDDIKLITLGAEAPLEKAQKLYAYMRSKFGIKEGGGKYMTDNPRNLWKNMKGTIADCNIMLVTLLRAAGINADPVMLSTRENGFSNEIYPLMNQYNYVIARTEIDGKEYYLDASNPMMAFGHLPLECYNGHARIVKAMPTAVYLEPDVLKENKTTMINLFQSGESEQVWVGSLTSKLGYYEGLSMRSKVKNGGLEKVQLDIKNSLPAEAELEALKINDLEDYEKPVGVSYNLDLAMLADDDLVYVSPLMGERQKDNPFSAAQRQYPVEMPYTFKETVVVNMNVPVGYEVDEMPKSTRVKLPDDVGQFEYLIQLSGSAIQLRCVVEIKKSFFDAENYDGLREFFTYVIKKQSEQIVLKKKANP